MQARSDSGKEKLTEMTDDEVEAVMSLYVIITLTCMLVEPSVKMPADVDTSAFLILFLCCFACSRTLVSRTHAVLVGSHLVVSQNEGNAYTIQKPLKV